VYLALGKGNLIAMNSQSFSVEFFPPKDEAGEDRLWVAIDQLRPTAPDFISVTYGAGGSTRDRTIRITREITERTGIDTVAHLTCVGSTREELENILAQYRRAGIESILALRGDPQDGPRAPWVTTPGGFDHADQLVELAQATGAFRIGVAAFPDGHPASKGDWEKDITTLLRKEQLGASFVTTQFFFDIKPFEKMVNELAKRGSKLEVIAGVLPITNVKQLTRMAELSGTNIPASITDAFAGIEDNPSAVKEKGIEIATSLSMALLNLDIAGLHFYTMNNADSTIAIGKNVGLI
jgi:methylenetetrahydrofolate reductase (NADPH)